MIDVAVMILIPLAITALTGAVVWIGTRTYRKNIKGLKTAKISLNSAIDKQGDLDTQESELKLALSDIAGSVEAVYENRLAKIAVGETPPTIPLSNLALSQSYEDFLRPISAPTTDDVTIKSWMEIGGVRFNIGQPTLDVRNAGEPRFYGGGEPVKYDLSLLTAILSIQDHTVRAAVLKALYEAENASEKKSEKPA